MCECLCSLKGATASAGNRQLPINADTVQFANSYLRSTGISSGVGKTITLCFFYQLIVLKLKLHETVQLKSDGKSHLVQVTINECFIRQCLGELKFKYCNSKIQGKLLHAVPPVSPYILPPFCCLLYQSVNRLQRVSKWWEVEKKKANLAYNKLYSRQMFGILKQPKNPIWHILTLWSS